VCGIAGFLLPPGGRADRAILERMVGTIRHRGPDAVGYHVDGRVALGVARLRVIDLETGDQPIANEDGSAHVVLNGEIYNYRRLRDELQALGHRFSTRSDTEVVVHGWEAFGEACPEALNGMFAFAVWDRRREELFLARDRMGEKPLYYTFVDGALVFASELRALLAYPGVRRRLDLRGLARYLAFDYIPDPHAILEDVAKLPPGHSLTVNGGKARTQRYWEIPFAPDETLDEAAWCAEIRRRLDDAVRLRLHSDVPVGCFLSGGIDSTAIAATAARQHTGIRTFSVGYAEAAYDERRFARLVATRYGTRHEELVVTADDTRVVLGDLGGLLDEPLADMSFVPLYLLSRAARRSVTVALSGDGGDELFAGYPSMGADWWHQRFARLPGPARAAFRWAVESVPSAPEPLRDFLRALPHRPEARNQPLVGGLPPERHAGLLSPGARAALAGFDPYTDIDAASASCASDDPTARLIHRYCKLYLAGQNLVNADRASMAVSLELRAPFLDHTFVEFMGRIPSRLKLRGLGSLKRLLKRAVADRLPPEILARGKHGFGVPFDEWFRGPLAPMLREILSPDRIRAVGLFDAAAVARLVDEHVAGAGSHRKLLWSLVAFEQWRVHYLGDARLG
jgi:asparagine synthase (glutamine-hydrolysing)